MFDYNLKTTFKYEETLRILVLASPPGDIFSTTLHVATLSIAHKTVFAESMKTKSQEPILRAKCEEYILYV